METPNTATEIVKSLALVIKFLASPFLSPKGLELELDHDPEPACDGKLMLSAT